MILHTETEINLTYSYFIRLSEKPNELELVKLSLSNFYKYFRG